MSAGIIGFVIGFFIGGSFGTICVALLMASRDEEDK